MKYLVVLFLCFGLPIHSYSFAPSLNANLKPRKTSHLRPRLKKSKIRLGDALVDVLYFKGQGKTFIHVHQNEKTALKAAFNVINKEGGSLITLRHPGGGRNIVFHLHKNRYEFDPNRIFTKMGIKKTLTQYSRFTPEASNEVNKLSATLKHMLPKGKVIAVHNNRSYSLKNYLPSHDSADEAKVLYVNPKQYFRNFYLFTQSADYKRLKSKGFNGVLQKQSPLDDGSLSVFLASRAYINVEAGHDQLRQQIKMLQQA